MIFSAAIAMHFAFGIHSQAFTLVLPDVRGWQVKELSFRTNYSACGDIAKADLDSAIDDALAVWNEVPTSFLRIKRGEETSEVGAVNSSPPIIQCDNTNSDISVGEEDFVPGIGFPAAQNGHMVAGYLALNKNGGLADISSTTQTKLRIVIAHEVGHILGLGHTGHAPSLMYYSIGDKKYLRLSQDDVDGISFLYPRNELGGDGLFGCGSVQQRINATKTTDTNTSGTNSYGPVSIKSNFNNETARSGVVLEFIFLLFLVFAATNTRLKMPTRKQKSSV